MPACILHCLTCTSTMLLDKDSDKSKCFACSFCFISIWQILFLSYLERMQLYHPFAASCIGIPSINSLWFIELMWGINMSTSRCSKLWFMCCYSSTVTVDHQIGVFLCICTFVCELTCIFHTLALVVDDPHLLQGAEFFSVSYGLHSGVKMQANEETNKSFSPQLVCNFPTDKWRH